MERAAADVVLSTMLSLTIVVVIFSFLIYACQAVLRRLSQRKAAYRYAGIERFCEEACPPPSDPCPQRDPPSLRERAVAAMEHISGLPRLAKNTPARELYDLVLKALRPYGRVTVFRKKPDVGVPQFVTTVLERVSYELIAPAAKAPLNDFSAGLVRAEKSLANIAIRLLPADTLVPWARLQTGVTTLGSIRDSISDPARGSIRLSLTCAEIERIILPPAETIFAPLDQLIEACRREAARNRKPRSEELKTVLDLLADTEAELRTAAAQLQTAIAVTSRRADALRRVGGTIAANVDARYAVTVQRFGLVVSALAVILLDANAWGVYHGITHSEVLRDQRAALTRALEQRDLALIRDERRLASAPPLVQEASATQLLDANLGLPRSSSEDAALAARVEREAREIDDVLDHVGGVGLHPLSGDRVGRWWDGLRYRNVGTGTWIDRRVDDAKHLIGWAVMIAILTACEAGWRNIGVKARNVLSTAAPQSPDDDA